MGRGRFWAGAGLGWLGGFSGGEGGGLAGRVEGGDVEVPSYNRDMDRSDADGSE